MTPSRSSSAHPSLHCIQGRSSSKIGDVRDCSARFLYVTSFFSNSNSPMVLCLVNCPAEVHFATIFALRNRKIFEVGVTHPPYPP